MKEGYMGLLSWSLASWPMVEETHEPKLGNMVEISGDVVAGRADSVERRARQFSIFSSTWKLLDYCGRQKVRG